jgi:hypothetical protein
MICEPCRKAGALLAEDKGRADAGHLNCISYKTSKTYCDCGHFTEASAIQETYRDMRQLPESN